MTLQVGGVIVIQSLAALAWIEARLRAVDEKAEARTAALRDEQRGDVAKEVHRIEEFVTDERDERRKEFSRVDAALLQLAEFGQSVVKVGASLDHMVERQDDHRASTDKQLDEIKHTVRNMSQKMDNLALDHARAGGRAGAGAG